jgi:hypothetical protein
VRNGTKSGARIQERILLLPANEKKSWHRNSRQWVNAAEVQLAVRRYTRVPFENSFRRGSLDRFGV